MSSRSIKASLWLIALLCVLHTKAGAQNALEPCLRNYADAYHIGINKIINEAVAHPPSLQLTTLPSFEAESGLRLVGTEIYFVQFRSFYWGESQVFDRHGVGHMDFSKPKIATKIRHAPLSAPLARLVEHTYSKAIAKARRSDQMGLDGTSYVFSTSDGSCGWTWSPGPRTRNGRLVELMKRLEEHAAFSAPIDLQRSEKVMMQLLQTIDSD